MTESVVQATESNIRAARKTMVDCLRRQVRELVRPVRTGPLHPILAFEGVLTDPGPKREPGPCVSTVQASFSVSFEVGKILRGSWAEKQVTVEFTGCGPLPSPPYHSGQRVLVFALRMEPGPPTLFHSGFLLSPEEMAEARAALEAAERSPGVVGQAPERSLSAQIRDFVRTAHDDRVSVLVFVGTLVSPIPERRFVPCLSKVMPSSALNS